MATPESTAGSPPALAPHPQPNPANLGMRPTIVTTKQWVVPPRPKPGRKPATDTPPTKRKAQNREAQRNFRERRAARIGELEEELEETREQALTREGELRSKIRRLEFDVDKFGVDVENWRLRCDALGRITDYERTEKERERGEKEKFLAELAYLRHGANTTGTDAVPLPPRRARAPLNLPEPEEAVGCGRCSPTGPCACVDSLLAQSGCGKCSPETNCQCLEETLNQPKRARSPVYETIDKRPRYSDPSTPLEVDFTAQFSSKPIEPPQVIPHITRPEGESCGFCDDTSYCMCAAEALSQISSERERENRLPPLLNENTPPPSDNDVEGTVKLPSLHPNQMHRPVAVINSCVNGPGTCQQCLSDPKSGLFCRSLAAMSGSNSVPDGCCGGNASGGGCCKTAPAAPSLSVADTYKTLSTHQNFDKATDEFGTWLGNLNAVAPRHPGRNQMEVEAASVMGVLKLFDRRFGRD